MEIEEKINQLENETTPGANTRGRVASILRDVKHLVENIKTEDILTLRTFPDINEIYGEPFILTQTQYEILLENGEVEIQTQYDGKVTFYKSYLIPYIENHIATLSSYGNIPSIVLDHVSTLPEIHPTQYTQPIWEVTMPYYGGTLTIYIFVSHWNFGTRYTLAMHFPRNYVEIHISKDSSVTPETNYNGTLVLGVKNINNTEEGLEAITRASVRNSIQSYFLEDRIEEVRKEGFFNKNIGGELHPPTTLIEMHSQNFLFYITQYVANEETEFHFYFSGMEEIREATSNKKILILNEQQLNTTIKIPKTQQRNEPLFKINHTVRIFVSSNSYLSGQDQTYYYINIPNNLRGLTMNVMHYNNYELEYLVFDIQTLI